MSTFVVPGELITADAGYLRGHGSYVDNAHSTHKNSNSSSSGSSTSNNDGPQLIAAVAGEIERVNKLISVRPFKSRYVGEVGDLVVGRVSSVDSKRWRVDLNGQKDAILQLSSVNLPGGVQRIRTYEDQLQMRTLFTENDLISAEVQNISADGVLSLHTRSLKYGKVRSKPRVCMDELIHIFNEFVITFAQLENGQLICVPASLIKRLPQHYVSLPWGVDILLGKNGFVWITRSVPEEWKLHGVSGAAMGDADEDVPLAETLQFLRRKHAETDLTPEERLRVTRVRNAVHALAQVHLPLSAEAVASVYQRSVDLQMETKDMIRPENILRLTESMMPNY